MSGIVTFSVVFIPQQIVQISFTYMLSRDVNFLSLGVYPYQREMTYRAIEELYRGASFWAP